MRIHLSKQEVDYLQNKVRLSSHLGDLLQEVRQADGGKLVLDLTEDDAIDFRDFLNEQLLLVGFDEDYNLTCIGRTLDELADRFYTG